MNPPRRAAPIHRVINPRVLYFGSAVVLISTENDDGTYNVAPMSSAWWVGSTCLLGLDETSATTANLRRSRELVLNLPDATMAEPVNRLALTTGTPDLPAHKAAKGFVHVSDKFSHAELTPVPSELVRPPRVAECPIALECTVSDVRAAGGNGSGLVSVEVEVRRTHAYPDVLVEGSDRHIDPERWDPLMMKFTHLYGHTKRLEPSRLAKGWEIPEPAPTVAVSPGDWEPVFDDVYRADMAQHASVSRWWLRAGAELPEHGHDRVEHLVVQQGVWRTDDGRVLRAGDTLTTAAGNTHGGQALTDTELLAIDVGSTPSRPEAAM